MHFPALPADLHPGRADVLALERQDFTDAIQGDKRHAAHERHVGRRGQHGPELVIAEDADRARLDPLDWTPRAPIVATSATDGSWRVRDEDGSLRFDAEMKERRAPHYLDPPSGAVVRIYDERTKSTRIEAPENIPATTDADRRRLEHELFGGEQAAHLVVRLRRKIAKTKKLPDWPEQFAAAVSDAALVLRLKAQWTALATRPLRKCGDPKCPVLGGRYFIARRNARDCPYCRRSRSKPTRWRSRRKELEATIKTKEQW
jgi:hypothetical protein